MSKVRVVVAVAVAVVSAVIVPAAKGATEDPNAYVATEEYFESYDGTRLHAYVWRPARAVEAGAKTPVLLTVTPYAGWGGHALSPDPFNATPPGPGSTDIFARGYARAIVELRGTGGSAGCLDLWGPNEIGDAKAAVEHYATAPWSTGKVGMTGASYDGFTQIAAIAAHAEGLAAVVAEAPPVGYHNLYHHGVRQTGGGHGFGALYVANDLYPPGVFAPTEQTANALRIGDDPACYAGPLTGPLDDDPASPYWVARDLARGAAGSKVPTIWRQGFDDWQVRPNGFTEVFASLAGPKLAVLGPWDHGAPRDGSRWSELAMGWLDHFLLGKPMPPRPDVLIQSPDGRWRAEAEWPPKDATPFTLPIRPGRYTDAPGNNGETGLPDAFPVAAPAPLPTGTGTWTFTPPLPHDVHTSGVGAMTLDVTAPVPGAHVVGLVYDVDAAGNAQLVTRGAAVVATAGSTTVHLYPRDHRFPAGHRIGVLVSGADDVWFEPPHTGAPVTLHAGTYALPFLAKARATVADGPLLPRPSHPPFTVDPATIESATLPSPLPPPLR